MLDRGANTKTKDKSGHGILYNAVKPNDRWSRFDQRRTMRLLIKRGADVKELNNKAEASAYRNCKRLLEERSDAWEY